MRRRSARNSSIQLAAPRPGGTRPWWLHGLPESASKRARRSASLAVDPGADQVLDIGVDMKSELGIHVALELSCGARCSRALGDGAEDTGDDQREAVPGLSASALSCFRPAAVNV